MKTQSLKVLNYFIHLAIWIYIFLLETFFTLITLSTTQITGEKAAIEIISSTIIYGLIASIIFSALHGKFGVSEKKNTKKFIVAIIEIVIIIAIGTFLSFRIQIDEHRDKISEQIGTEVEDLEGIFKPGLQNAENQEFNVESFLSNLGDPSTEIGIAFKNTLESIETLRNERKQEISNSESISVETYEDFTNVNKMITIRKYLEEECDKDSQYYDKLVKKYISFQVEAVSINSPTAKYLAENIKNSINKNKKLKELIENMCSSYDNWYSFIILNNDDLSFEDETLLFGTNEILEKFNVLEEKALNAENEHNTFASEIQESALDALKEINTE